jgi:heme/copper-type cytochrome/quinol oxidase subunit 2
MRKSRLSSTPVITLLAATGVASVAAFVLAPAALLRGAGPNGTALPDAVGRALTEYWNGTGAAYPDRLARLVDYWFRWHAIKVGISAVLLTVFALLATALWRRYLDGTANRAATATGATVLPVLAAGLLILNLQATAVPLVALLPLTDDLRPPQPPGGPAWTVLLTEVQHYHWIMVALAGTTLIATTVAAVACWRKRRTGHPRTRVMRRTLSIILAVTATLLLAVTTISAISATQPADALYGLLGQA